MTTHSPASNAIEAMGYCAETDPQASRFYFILTAFRDVVFQHRTGIAQTFDTHIQPQVPGMPQPIPLSNERNEPVAAPFLTSPPPLAAVPAAHTHPTPLFPDPQSQRTDLSISPPQHVSAHTPGASSHAPTVGYSPEHKDAPSGLPTPQSSWDPFLELAHVSGDKTNEANDSLIGDAEIEFESLWQWPNHEGTGFMPTGANLTPGGTTLMPGGAAGLKH
jgi:hypothetical protein